MGSGISERESIPSSIHLHSQSGDVPEMRGIGRHERLAGNKRGGGDEDIHISGRLSLPAQKRGDSAKQQRGVGPELQDRQLLQGSADDFDFLIRIIGAIDANEQFSHIEAGGRQQFSIGKKFPELVRGAAAAI